MRTALISDIHGNGPGLDAVLQDIAGRQCDRILCLGDLVDGGANDVDVARYVRDHYILTVRGNHDAINDLTLPPDVSEYLRSLPEQIVEDDILYTHISPRRRQDKILSDVEAWNVFDETTYRILFVGHAHIPLIWGEQCIRPVSATAYPADGDLTLDPADRYIVCVGSVGYSRDSPRRLHYTIYDSDAQRLEMRSVDGPLLPFG